MIIYPAIDLRGGRAVRLTKGDYDQMKVYNDDPAAVAQGFREAGATHLHVVDLDGARKGVPQNEETIRALTEVGLFTEVLRDDFAKAFDQCDTVTFMDVYAAGETPVPGVSGKTFMDVLLESPNHPE